MIERNDPCFCGSGKKWKKCHYPQQPSLADLSPKELYLKKYNILLKTAAEILGIKKASKFTATLLKILCEKAKAGVTTKELEQFARSYCKQHKVTCPTIGYGHPPFPAAICTSLNDVICHGIPNDIPLKEGDILNIDVACVVNGYYGDCSAMVCVGKVSEEKKLVVDVAYECMMRAISILKPGLQLKEIGNAIEGYARAHHCSVVDCFVSHGVGIEFHEEPQIAHHYNSSEIPLAAGMTFTVEPMINAGVKDAIIDKHDGWTARTKDGKPSAQWEHTVLITEDGHEILTIPEQY